MEQPDILRFAVNTLEQFQIPDLIVGALASSIWGEPRLIMNIDIVIDLRADQIPSWGEAFPTRTTGWTPRPRPLDREPLAAGPTMRIPIAH